MKKTLIVFVLVLAMMLQLVPFSAFAVEEIAPADAKAQLVEAMNTKNAPSVEAIENAEDLEMTALEGDSDAAFTNPLYPEHAEANYASHVASADEQIEADTLNYMNLSDALDYFTECLEDRQYSINFTTWLPYYPYLEHLDAMFVLAKEHNGNPTQGDYIEWHWKSYSRTGSKQSYGGGYLVQCQFYVNYYTTYAQETALTTRVNQIINSLGLSSSSSDFEKAYKVYEWVTGNITYDHVYDSAMMRHTAYNGIMYGTCVCQGYASIMYRMLLQLGVDCRVIAGDASSYSTPNDPSDDHGWNIAKIDGKYYNLDATWDADYAPVYWEYFLKCPANFTYHTRWDDYNTSDFHSDYPMASSDYKWSVAKKNGICEVNGVYGYYIDDVLQTWYTGLVDYNGYWYYVENGLVNWDYVGLVSHGGNWIYVEGGMANWNYTGLTQFSGNWYVVENGAITWTYNGLIQYYGNWYYAENSQINWSYTGMTQFCGNWYVVENGAITWTYTGLIQYYGNWYYAVNSQIAWNYVGLVNHGGNWIYVETGMPNWSYTGLVQHAGNWYYVQDGMITWAYTGIVSFNGNQYYVINSEIAWNYTGDVYFNGVWYYVVNGIAQ